jgi:hypothetical protein
MRAMLLTIALVIIVVVGISVRSAKQSLSSSLGKLGTSGSAAQQQNSGKVTVMKGISAELPGTPIRLAIALLQLPGDDCRDCITTATVDVVNNSSKITLIYTSGGFTGQEPKPQNAFGYQFTLESITESSVTLSYKKL